MNPHICEFAFIQNIQRAIKSLEKSNYDGPCYYELLLSNGYSIITKRDNKKTSIKWSLVDHMNDYDNEKEKITKGYSEIKF